MQADRTKDIDGYIASFPAEAGEMMKKLRLTIREAAPQAKEVMSYGMPAFRQNENLVYFAAYKYHIGFYPTSSGISAFYNELSAFKVSKGTIQFPIGTPLPLELITRIVKFRLDESMAKAEIKSKIKQKHVTGA